MLIGGGEPQTTTTGDPELLFEEARELQRRRQKRRTTVLVAAGVLVVLGLGAYRNVSRNTAASAQNPSPVLAVARQPVVIYEKVETVAVNLHNPTFRRTGAIWFSPAAPLAYREILTIAGGPTVEVGARLARDPRFGPEQLVLTYLFDAKANTIYETGAHATPPIPPTPPPSPGSAFRHLVTQPGVRIAGTRLFEGHKVYVVHVAFPMSARWTFYFDTATYQPLLQVEKDFPGSSYIIRVLAYRTLPATDTNLDLTSLAGTHTGARLAPWPPPPRIDDLYGEASQMPKQAGGLAAAFGGGDLGPFGG
jgi:hypothetical protein